MYVNRQTVTLGVLYRMSNVLLSFVQIIYRLKVTLYELKAWSLPMGARHRHADFQSTRCLHTQRETNTHTRFFTNLILIFTLSTLNVHFMCTFDAQFVPNNVSIESPLSPEHKLNLRIFVEIQKNGYILIQQTVLLFFFMFIPFMQKV